MTTTSKMGATPSTTHTQNTAADRGIPPSFAGAEPAEIEDAMIMAGRMTNRLPISWTQPNKDVTVSKFVFGDLKLAASGMLTVSELLLIMTSSNDLKVKPSVINGLTAAAVALALAVDSGLDRIEAQGERHD